MDHHLWFFTGAKGRPDIALLFQNEGSSAAKQMQHNRQTTI